MYYAKYIDINKICNLNSLFLFYFSFCKYYYKALNSELGSILLLLTRVVRNSKSFLLDDIYVEFKNKIKFKKKEKSEH